MIIVQGPLITDRYTKPSPKETYTLCFLSYNRDIILWKTELDFSPTREQISEIWNTEVKTLYPEVELF
jgi:hypothetical protein